MVTAAMEFVVAKPKRNDVPVKLDAEVARKAKMVAASQDKSLAEYISETLRPIVTRALEKTLTDMKLPKPLKD